MAPKLLNLKKNTDIIPHPLCLGNISKDWSVDNMKKTGFNGLVYDFSIDYDYNAVDDILDIHKYLIKKNYLKMFGFIKKVFFTGLAILTSVNPLNASSTECNSIEHGSTE